MRQTPIRGSGLLVQLLVGVIIGAALALIVLVGFPGEELTANSSSLMTSAAAAANSKVEGSVVVGAHAPNFILQDLDGLQFALDDFEGNIVLLNFWATWCGPCRLEMPLLEGRFREFADQGFVILAINLGETPEEVKAFVDELGLTFPVLLDTEGEVSELYRIIGYPSTVLIDPQGFIQTIHIGILSEVQLQDYLHQAGLSA